MNDTSYMTVEEADALATSQPAALVSSYLAAADDAKLAALTSATSHFDASYRFQGRRYDPAQALEFPRVARGVATPLADNFRNQQSTEQIWDWDGEANLPIVPRNVKIAVLLEANSVIANDRGHLQKMHDGLSSQSNSGMSETYRDPSAGGAAPVLCREADLLAKKYRLRAGDLR